MEQNDKFQPISNTLVKVFIVIAPLLVGLAYAIVGLTDPIALLLMHGERHFIENATVIFMLVTAVISAVNLFSWRRHYGRWSWFYAVVAAGLWLVAMEEMSWGQHLLGFESSEFFMLNNAQQETNLHNLIGLKSLYVYYIPMLIYGVLLPVMRDAKQVRALVNIGLLAVPSRLLIPTFAIACVFGLRQIVADDPLTYASAEMVELVFAVGLTVDFLMQWRALNVRPTWSRRREAIGWVTVTLLAIGLTGWGAFSTWQNEVAYVSYKSLLTETENEVGEDSCLLFVLRNGTSEEAHQYLRGRVPRNSETAYTILPDGHSEDTLEKALGEYEQLYAFYFGGWGTGQTAIKNYLDSHSYRLESAWHNNVLVNRYLSLDPTAKAHSVGAALGETLWLEDYRLQATDNLAAGGGIGVSLRWSSDEPVNGFYKVFVHVYDDAGQLIAQHDGVPSNGSMPTDNWEVQTPVIDRHGIGLPDDISDGTYTLAVGMYDSQTGVRLPVRLADGTMDDKIVLTTLQVGS